MPVRVVNTANGAVVADRAAVAATSQQRREGLLKRNGLDPGEGLWIKPCEAVHCFFMKFTIDVVFLNKQGKVVKLTPSLRPWRIAGSLRAHSVLELPEGRIAACDIQPGHTLAFERLTA
jgi:uncharacterized membrane protein (UPF0127 family)